VKKSGSHKAFGEVLYLVSNFSLVGPLIHNDGISIAYISLSRYPFTSPGDGEFAVVVYHLIFRDIVCCRLLELIV
jgi:hypothetical protein